MCTKVACIGLIVLAATLTSCKREDAPQGGPSKKVTKVKVAKVKPISEARFKEMDKNGDGKLGVNELVNHVSGRWPLKMGLREFDTKDQDEDGALSFKEFTYATKWSAVAEDDSKADAKAAAPPPAEPLTGKKKKNYKKCFAMADFNGDGKLSKKELWKALPDTPLKRVWIGFKLLDKDGDGVLTLEEYLGAAGKAAARAEAKAAAAKPADEQGAAAAKAPTADLPAPQPAATGEKK